MGANVMMATSSEGVQDLETHRVHLLEKYGHPDIVMAVDDQPGIDWLINYFSDQVRDGVHFKSGQTVQIGWALLKLSGDDSKELRVFEPDFASMPVRWVSGISRAMRHLTIQREVCKQVGESPCFPSMVEPGVVSPNFVSGRSAFSMSRDNDGWLFRAREDEGHQAGLCSLYALATERTAAIPFLALPPGTEVDWERGSAVISFNGRQHYSRSNAFLNRMLASSALL